MQAKTFKFNLEELNIFAQEVAKNLKAGDIICLKGDLGTGKTTFSQFLIRSLTNPNESVTSPTFNLVHNYKSPKGMIWHFDLYRLENREEIYNLGIEDAFEDGISIIEWPEIIEDILPSEAVKIDLNYTDEDLYREVTISK